MLVNNTPVQIHHIAGRELLVKREDLCAPFPGPSFSKIRGVVAHIQNRPEGFIGVLDTFHSKAGWAVSYVCQHLGKQAINFWPKYKADRVDSMSQDPLDQLPRIQQRQAFKLGALLRPLPAGRSAVLYHSARKQLHQEFPGSYLMPNALKLPESVTENAAEARRTCEAGAVPDRGTLIISVSSGTVAAGVLRGFADAGVLDGYGVVLHMGYSRSIDTMRTYMEKVSGLDLKDRERFQFVDEGYGYADAAPASFQAPFPINPFYDKKALAWLARDEAAPLFAKGPVVLWSIGD